MDEKEGLPEKPSEDSSQTFGDDSGKSTEKGSEETSAVEAVTGPGSPSEKSEVKTGSDVADSEIDRKDAGDSDLQNHVDHDASVEDNNSVISDVGEPKQEVTDVEDIGMF